MRESQGDKERLWHILDSIESIESFCEEVDEPSFRANYMLQLAVVKLLEIIGEASSRLSKQLRDEYSKVEWSLIIHSRNVLVHGYFAINLDIIWESIQKDLPTLKIHIKEMIEQKFGIDKP